MTKAEKSEICRQDAMSGAYKLYDQLRHPEVQELFRTRVQERPEDREFLIALQRQLQQATETEVVHMIHRALEQLDRTALIEEQAVAEHFLAAAELLYRSLKQRVAPELLVFVRAAIGYLAGLCALEYPSWLE